MKIQTTILAGVLLLSLAPVFAQSEEDAGPRAGRAGRPAAGFGRAPELVLDTSALTKFNLDFPGGKPKELVAAIQKASGKPLNAIVPDEFADVKLPPLKMANVNVADLFRALTQASMRQVAVVTGRTFFGDGGRQPNYNYSVQNIACGFRTTEGRPTEESIWYFFADKPVGSPHAEDTPGRVARFYLLTPYLERGLTVDDITTAIQTSWKMLGEKETPSISFHKETKLLIAVGDATKLDTIDAVLKALEPPQSPRGRGFGGGGGGFGSGGFGGGGFGGGGFGGTGGRGSTPSTNTTPTEEPKND